MPGRPDPSDEQLPGHILNEFLENAAETGRKLNQKKPGDTERQDGDEMDLFVAADGDQVVLDFGRIVKQVGMSPQAASRLATALTRASLAARGIEPDK